VIIVEGGDNVGKSTLVKQLVALDPSLRLLHRERFKPSEGGTIFSSYLKMLLPTDDSFMAHANSIGDRCFASECVYGALFRDGCRMTFAEHLVIQAILQKFNALVVHCDPPDEVIKASWDEREQLYDNPLAIAEAYRVKMPNIFSGLEVIHYDWTRSSAPAFREWLVAENTRRVNALAFAICTSPIQLDFAL
jgi:hypothetical protein